ncbi:hypothetical protein [Methylobacterium nigriterrae]|uniref:hypothetical protein n=1 Tax=Methylobacterium nigriterrae TaxID=3127512 RepID=UPI0030140A4D
MISELNKIPDISLRMHRYKRDLIYLSEVAEKEDEMPYCIALAWRMNLGLTKHPDALETPITFSGNLAQRVKDLIRCCDAETLELHPLLKSHLAAAEKQA